ncbi:phage capsid protein [Marispirochaeta sp.]|uniref:phage capsid protein n=1 Tax=Marispirochaeta sp. TaxID=2038653 RepID=UPI0029C8E5AF|nr:phage capsid protein [Marispirochaeta sp.]
MALTAATIPIIIGKAILESLKTNLVYSRLFNTDYIGELQYGNTVKIPSIGSVTVGAYTRYNDLVPEQVADSAQDLTISHASQFSIVIDDLDRAQARPDVMAAYAREAVFQMNNTIDKYLAGVAVGGGTLTADLGNDSTPIEVNSSNVGTILRLIARKLDDAKVPRVGRVVVVPPWMVEDLVGANISESTNNVDELRNGFVTRYAGFDVLMSGNVPNTDGEKYKIIAGSPISATWGSQVEKTEMIRHPNFFGDVLRGLVSYGAKVTRAATLAIGTVNEAAEA